MSNYKNTNTPSTSKKDVAPFFIFMFFKSHFATDFLGQFQTIFYTLFWTVS